MAYQLSWEGPFEELELHSQETLCHVHSFVEDLIGYSLVVLVEKDPDLVVPLVLGHLAVLGDPLV